MKYSCLVPFYRLCIIGFLLMPSRQIRPALPSRQCRNLSPALPHGTHHSRQPSKPRVPVSPPSTPSHASPHPPCRSVSRHRSRHTHGRRNPYLLTGTWLHTAPRFTYLPERRGCLPCQAVAYWGYALTEFLKSYWLFKSPYVCFPVKRRLLLQIIR